MRHGDPPNFLAVPLHSQMDISKHLKTHPNNISRFLRGYYIKNGITDHVRSIKGSCREYAIKVECSSNFKSENGVVKAEDGIVKTDFDSKLNPENFKMQFVAKNFIHGKEKWQQRYESYYKSL